MVYRILACDSDRTEREGQGVVMSDNLTDSGSNGTLSSI
jgi:hypothetical protein